LATGDADGNVDRLFYGFVVASSTSGGSDGEAASVLTPSLDDAVVDRNLFQNLAAAVLVNADVGDVRIEANRVIGSHAGFWIEGSAFLHSSGKIDAAEQRDPLIGDGLTLARGYPRTKGFDLTKLAAAGTSGSSGAAEKKLPTAAPKTKSAATDAKSPSPLTGSSLADAAKAADSASPMSALDGIFAGLEATLASAPATPKLDLMVVHNDVGVIGGGLGEGTALFVAVRSDKDDDRSSAIVSANKLRNKSTDNPTTMMVA